MHTFVRNVQERGVIRIAFRASEQSSLDDDDCDGTCTVVLPLAVVVTPVAPNLLLDDGC